MCLVLFSFDLHPEYQYIVAGNRDEFYERPTQPLGFWKDEPLILAGRDLAGGGAWLGITKTLKFAAITNYRDSSAIKKNAPSRGNLVRNFLAGKVSPERYLEHVRKTGHKYNGFNLLIGEKNQLWYYSNRGKKVQKISSGFYGLSNHFLDTPWPKVKKSKSSLKTIFDKKRIDAEAVFEILSNQQYPPEDQLPDTGVGPFWERILSPVFIRSNLYGTRSSSILLVKKTGQVTFIERTFSTIDGGLHQNTQTFNFSGTVTPD
jgi:uncharacterized protein with NRDE domain